MNAPDPGLGQRTGFTIPLEDVNPSGGAITLSPGLSPYRSMPTCVACGREVVKLDDEGQAVALDSFDSQELKKAVHWDGSLVCTDWVAPVLKRAEEKLRQFDREGRERGLPGPLQRDPSEPIVVEVTWCRNRSTEA